MSGNPPPATAANPPSSTQDKDLEQIIQYFRKKGLKQSEIVLRNETLSQRQPLESLALKMHVEMENPAEISNFIKSYPHTSEAIDPKNFAKQYSAFREWISASLDMYQQELIGLLFPVFVHSFLDLIAKNLIEESQNFFQNFAKEHEELHEDEIHQLQSIKSVEKLKENELAQNFRTNQFSIELSRFSFELMLSFLHERNHLIVLAILNQHVHFKIVNAKPNLKSGLNSVQIYNPPAGKSEKEKKFINEKELYWGLFDEQLPKNREKDEDLSSMDEEPKKKGDKGKGKEIKVGNKMEGKKETKSNTKIPKLTERMELEYLQDLSHRASLSVHSLPSICFYTAFHSYHGLNHIEVSSDASFAAGCFSDSSVRLWDVRRKGRKEEEDSSLLLGHSGPVFSASFSPDSQWLLTSSEDKTVRLWNTQTKTNLVCYKSHNYPVWSVDFSSIGYYFATGSHDRTARLWSTDHVNPLRVFAGHLSDVNVVKFHPNCNYIASGSADKSIRLWDINSSAPVRIFTGHFGGINALAISPDGKLLASAADDNSIIVWNLGTSKRMATFTGHKSTVWSLDFSADGNLLASGSADETVRLWDLSGQSTKKEENEDETQEEGQQAALATSEKSTNSVELVKTFPTKRTPVFQVKFTRRNLLLAAGAYRGPESQSQS